MASIHWLLFSSSRQLFQMSSSSSSFSSSKSSSLLSWVSNRAFLLTTALLLLSATNPHQAGHRSLLVSCDEINYKCEPITIPMCRGIGYNMTYMPNQFNHDSQAEAGLEVHQFYPLVKIQCSPDLKFFLCSMYVPICMDYYKHHLPACRSVCERAKQGCAPLMRQYGFVWPEQLNCDKLPVFGGDVMCMDDNNTKSATLAPPPGLDTPRLDDRGRKGGKNNGVLSDKTDVVLHTPKENPGGVQPIPNVKGFHFNPKGQDTGKCQCKCEPPLVAVTETSSTYYNNIRTGGLLNCALNCHGPYFSDHERTYSSFWVGLWSILCCISTAATMSTFFVDMKRFKYPERPIIFLSACYFMVSLGYIIPFLVGHEGVACQGDKIRYETTGPPACTVVFLLVYFFGMASSIWWVILSFTWFLAAGLKWGQEAIASYSQYFHFAAWLIPSIKSIAVLAMSSVDGDPISGICYVGNQNVNNLRGFVLAPLFVYLIIGTSFLLAGFVSLFRIRNVIKQQGRGKTDKLERLMIRIGVFSVLYTVPATIVIACYFYEQRFREDWEKTKTCDCYEDKAYPNYTVFMLKYFMCLVIGTTSGFWIWSGKTVASWRTFFQTKLCCCQQSNYHNRKYTNTSYHPAKQTPMSHV